MNNLQVIAALLREGGNVKILVRGNSMRPYLIHERDHVVLRREERVRVGDIVLAEIKPGHFVLHRVVGIDGNAITLRGDGNTTTEHCLSADVCGTVVGFYRKGSNKLQQPDTLGYCLYRFFWMHSLPLRPYMLYAHNLLFASCKNLDRLTPSGREVEVFLSLLRSALWATEAMTDLRDVRWQAVCQLAKEQTVLGLVADAASRLPDDVKPTGHEARFLRNGSFALLVAHQRLNASIVKAFGFLAGKSFTPILLKGQGNATFYPNPLLRQCGDIDVYIGEKDYARACECVAELIGQDAAARSQESAKHLHVSFGKDTIELHRVAEVQANPICNRRYLQLTNEWLNAEKAERVVIAGSEIMVPPLYFNCIYVFNHAWHHFINGGISVRQLCDWSMVLHRAYGSVDVHRLELDLHRLRLVRGWQLLGWVAVNKLGLPAAEMPLYTSSCESKALRVWEQILEGGNFGFYRNVRPKTIRRHWLLRKMRSFVASHGRFLSVFTIAPEDYFFAYVHWLIYGVADVVKRITK